MDTKDSCVFYADWLDAARTIDNVALRCMFLEIVLQYALTGMEVEVPNELKLTFSLIKKQIDRDREKYTRKCEKNRENIRKRYERLQSNTNSTNVYERTMSNTNVGDNDNVNDNGNDNVNDNDDSLMKSDLNNNPQTPLKGKEGAGAKRFDDFYLRVRQVSVPKMVMDIDYTAQYVWRMAEGNPGYAIAVGKAITQAGSNKEALKNSIQAINSRFKPVTEFEAVKLALTIQRLTPAQQKAVLEEAKRAAGESDLWKTLLGKAEYMAAGNKVGNLAGFMKARVR